MTKEGNMSFTLTEYRQFITEIKYLTKQKEHSGFLNKIKKSFIVWSNAKKILNDSKDAYNYTFINICEKYGLNTDEIYEDLDLAWENGNKLANIPTLTGISLLQYTFYEYKKKTITIAEKHARKELNLNESI